jgi:hypothetical protein
MEGKTVRCKDCDETFTVTDPDTDRGIVTADSRRKSSAGPVRGRSRDDDEYDRPSRARRGREDDDEDVRPARRGRRDDDDEDRPARRRRKSKSSGSGGLVLALAIGGGLLVVGVVVVLLFTLLGGKFDPEKFNQVKNGMSEKEVIDLLGRPSETFDAGALGAKLGGVKLDAKSMVWKHNNKAYAVSLMNGQVVAAMSFGMDGKELAFNMNDFNFDPKKPGVNPFDQNFPKIPNNPPADPKLPTVPNNPPADPKFPTPPNTPTIPNNPTDPRFPTPPNNPMDPRFPNPPNFPGNPMNPPPANPPSGNPPQGSKPDWNRLQAGMTEQEIQTIFGRPTVAEDVQPNQLTALTGLTLQQITRPNGQRKPVRALVYVDGANRIEILLVDGRVYRFKK